MFGLCVGRRKVLAFGAKSVQVLLFSGPESPADPCLLLFPTLAREVRQDNKFRGGWQRERFVLEIACPTNRTGLSESLVDPLNQPRQRLSVSVKQPSFFRPIPDDISAC